MEKQKIVVAYSGGLDTSVMVKWLKEKYDAEIITVTGDLGQNDDFSKVEAKALATGASKAYVIDGKKEFIEDYAWKALKANALYEEEYPLATAIGRPLLVKMLVDVAKKEGADIIAHGCTGKGNDQVRIEVGLKTLMPEAKILAPLRTWEFKTREQELDYAIENNIPVSITKSSPYSIDENLWGSATECGILENTENAPPADAYNMTASPKEAPETPLTITLEFEKGIPVAIDGINYSAEEIVSALNKLAGEYGIGRFDMIENRVVGIKSREIYEAPGAAVLIKAHKELEKMVLDKETYRFKQTVSDKISNMIYDGQWFSPLFDALSAFIDETQKFVEGKIVLEFYKGSISVLSRYSKYSLYNEKLATYSDGDSFNHGAATGFLDLVALPFQTAAKVRKAENEGAKLEAVGR